LFYQYVPMDVDVFIPCYIDQFYPDKAENIFKVLNALGINGLYNPAQTCCGQLAFNSGNIKEAEELAVKFLKDFQGKNYIIAPSASCVHMVKKHYTKFFFNTSLHLESKNIQSRIYDFNDFLVNIIELEKWEGRFETTVCFHDSCSMLRHYGLKNEPRKLLSMIGGVELIEMKDSTECCGFGGSFSVKYPELSIEMGKRKLQNALDTGAEYLVSTEASCLFHLESIIKKENLNIKTATIADLMAWSIQ